MNGCVIVRDLDLYGTDAVKQQVLAQAKTWFVVGLGDSPHRPAYGVARFLQSIGKRVIPIHLRAQQVHGEPGYATLAEAVAVEGRPDVVDMFVNSTRVGEFVDEAIAQNAGAVWLQLGVIDEAAAQRASDAGLTVVMDACPAIEWRG